MPKFRKKTLIDAVRWTGDLHALSQFAGKAVTVNEDLTVTVATMEGAMTGQHGDWIAKGAHGEFYPIAAAVFADTYEPVE